MSTEQCCISRVNVDTIHNESEVTNDNVREKPNKSTAVQHDADVEINEVKAHSVDIGSAIDLSKVLNFTR